MPTATKRTVADRIRRLYPCGEALSWGESYKSPKKAWKECQRGDWMLWLIGRTDKSLPWSDDRKPLVACCLDCALTVKHLWPAKHRESLAANVKVLRQWTEGKATTSAAKLAREELRKIWYSVAVAAAGVAVADVAAGAARVKSLAKCAVIVRKHYPNPPKV